MARFYESDGTLTFMDDLARSHSISFDKVILNGSSAPRPGTTAAGLRQVIAEAGVMLERLNRYGDDIYEDGNVILFDRQFVAGGTVYSYAAIKANGLWYTTGPKSPKSYTWEQLVAWLTDAEDDPELWLVTKVEPL